MRKRAARVRKRAALVLVVSLVGALFSGAPSVSAKGCSSEETIPVHTLNMKVKYRSGTYRPGDAVKFKVTVTRPGDEDPLGQGIEIGDPPVSFPAEGVSVGLGARIGDVFLFDFGITNAEGKTTVRMKIPSYAPNGSATIYGQSTVDYPAPCFIIREVDYYTKARAYRVRR